MNEHPPVGSVWACDETTSSSKMGVYDSVDDVGVSTYTNGPVVVLDGTVYESLVCPERFKYVKVLAPGGRVGYVLAWWWDRFGQPAKLKRVDG